MQVERKHILLITTSFPRGTPGQEAAGGFVYDIASRLSKTLIVTVVAPGNDSCIEQIDGINVYRYSAPEQALSALKLSSPKGFYWTLRVFFSGYRATKKAIKEQPSLKSILAFWIIPSGLWALLAARGKGIRFSSWALGSDIWSYSRNPLTRFILKKVLQASDRRYADGFQLCSDVEKIGNVSCEMIPSARLNSEDALNMKESSAPYNLVFVGRWHTNKGVDILLDALLELNDEDWSKISAVRIAGGGPLEQLVKDKAATLKSRGRPVECSGYVGKDELYRLFKWADYYFLPSRIESIPVILSDGVANRIPVIATPVGDVKLLCDKFRLGTVSLSVSIEDYRDAIREVLQSGGSGTEINAQGFFELLDQDRSIKEILSLVD